MRATKFGDGIDAERQCKGGLRLHETDGQIEKAVDEMDRISIRQWDIVNAAKKLAAKAVAGEIAIDDIDAEAVQAEICLAEFPPLDLMIRTGGENRISNFLLWQVAYSELYFSDLYWPDFDLTALQNAIEDYESRQRRFGRTGDQIEAATRES